MEKEAQNDTKMMPHVDNDVPAKVLMSFYLEGDLPIDGGWGYGKDDAVVITTDNPAEGVHLEYEFTEQRAQLEALKIEGCYYDSFQSLRQSVRIIDKIHYDVIEAEVTMCDDDDNETKYRTECWFNVEKLFESYSKLIKKNQDNN